MQKRYSPGFKFALVGISAILPFFLTKIWTKFWWPLAEWGQMRAKALDTRFVPKLSRNKCSKWRPNVEVKLVLTQ